MRFPSLVDVFWAAFAASVGWNAWVGIASWLSYLFEEWFR